MPLSDADKIVNLEDLAAFKAKMDESVLHKTGNETLGGLKTFENTQPTGDGTENTISSLYVRNPEITRGTPLEDGYSFSQVMFLDAGGEAENTHDGRLGMLQFRAPKVNGDLFECISIGCYRFSDDPDDAALHTSLRVGYDENGVAYASAPSTQLDSVRDEGTDIVTKNWIPKDTRIVHATGDESIGGTKTFTSNVLFGTEGKVSSSGNIFKQADTSTLYVCGGSSNASANGSLLILAGASASTNPGVFTARTGKVGGVYAELVGKPDGTLTWDGQPLQTSSDERVKTSLSAVPDAVLDAWEEVNWGQFQYLDAVASKGESARLHLGLIAQRVKAVFDAHGLDACAYGILCHEEHEAAEDSEAVDLWMVRYAEAQAMEACCMRRENARLKKRIAALEAKLA